jgi:hypothetical protein
LIKDSNILSKIFMTQMPREQSQDPLMA